MSASIGVGRKLRRFRTQIVAGWETHVGHDLNGIVRRPCFARDDSVLRFVGPVRGEHDEAKILLETPHMSQLSDGSRNRRLQVVSLLLLMPMAVSAADQPSRYENMPIGWAEVEGGTTGGKGGPTVRVTDEAALVQHLKGNEPATIVIAGPIALQATVRVGSNKTIFGEGDKAVLTGADLHLSKISNVISRNLAIHDSADDAINVEGRSHHIWIDHCDLSACHDGLLDIKHGRIWSRFLGADFTITAKPA